MSSLSDDGFLILRGVTTVSQCSDIAAEIDRLLESNQDDTILSGQGRVVGGRNLIDWWHEWKQLTNDPLISELIDRSVGNCAGLVRILYFDKPPGDGWALSMHRDETIAVASHIDPPTPFSRPTTKAGVPHVVANRELLSHMLTLRLHLDPMHDRNGPLTVVPGSHHLDRPSDQKPEIIRCNAGDVFAMRPLLLHGSRAADNATTDHRRVVHLEIAPAGMLPKPYRWHRWKTIQSNPSDPSIHYSGS